MRKKYLVPLVGIVVGLILASIPMVALGSSAISWFSHTSESSGSFETVSDSFSEEFDTVTLKGENIKNIEISFNDTNESHVSGLGDTSDYTVGIKGKELIIQTSSNVRGNTIFYVQSFNTAFEFDTVSISLGKNFNKGRINIKTLVSDIAIKGTQNDVLDRVHIETISTKVTIDTLNTQLKVEAFNLELQTLSSGGTWDLNSTKISMDAKEVSTFLDLNYNAMSFEGALSSLKQTSYDIELSGLSLYLNDKGESRRSLGSLTSQAHHSADEHFIEIEGDAVSQKLTIR